MNDTDKIQFAELCAAMGENFQKEVSKPMLRIYWNALSEYDYAEVERGIMKVLTTRKITGTLPVVAEIIEAIQNQNGSPEERAEIAWSKLIYAIEHLGHMASVQFDDHHIHDTVQALGGWLRVNSADGDVYNEDWLTKNLTWRKKDFIRMYLACASRRPVLEYLPGLQEIENRGKYDGFMPRVAQIGGRAGNIQIGYSQLKELQ